MKTPNIFEISSKELSQDAFFAWLIRWGDPELKDENPNLFKAAQDFIRFLIASDEEHEIERARIRRQWMGIDIIAWITTNKKKYLIVIEDKLNANQHGNQLERYKKKVENHCKEELTKKNDKLTPVYIYLKTGNDSLRIQKRVEDEGYRYIGRMDVLKVIRKREVENDVFNEFKSYLEEVEEETNSYKDLSKVISSWRAAEGFYIELQKRIGEWSEWRYISNSAGGFLGFWYNFKEIRENVEVYIQIENTIKDEGGNIKLLIRLKSKKGKLNEPEELIKKLNHFAKKHNDIAKKHNDIAKKHRINIIIKESVHRSQTATIATVNNAFPNEGDNIAIDEFVALFAWLQDMLGEFAEDYKEAVDQGKTS